MEHSCYEEINDGELRGGLPQQGGRDALYLRNRYQRRRSPRPSTCIAKYATRMSTAETNAWIVSLQIRLTWRFQAMSIAQPKMLAIMTGNRMYRRATKPRETFQPISRWRLKIRDMSVARSMNITEQCTEISVR